MKVPHIQKNRFIWLILILMISLGLVSVALAAANSTGKTLISAPANQTQPEAQEAAPPVQSLPPSPFVTSSNQPETQSAQDQLAEKMRLQAISYSVAQQRLAQTENPSFSPDEPGLVLDPLDPKFQVNYRDDWVEGSYAPGYQVWITVTNSLSEVRATAHGVTAEIPWWGGGTGFSTQWNGGNVPWDGGVQPDLQVGDFVYVKLDNGHSGELRIGGISGELHSDTDTFEGTLNIPWLTGKKVYVQCMVWGGINGPSFGVGLVDPMGTFTCDFGWFGFDLQPGMDIGVSYTEADQNQVLTGFREPSPNLYINQEPIGRPAEGNNYVFRLHYNNDGIGTVSGVVITQTFEGMEYISDTSGLAPAGTGDPSDPLVWQVGSLANNHMNEPSFLVFVHVAKPISETVIANAGIYGVFDYWQDPNRIHHHWEDVVKESNSDLIIYKNAWTGNPVPGHDFVYNINVCNIGDTPSSDVYITDTLPLTTTFLSWWSQYPGWEEVTSSAHQLVLTRPTAPTPGNWCGEVYVNVHLSESAWPGSPLHNDAWVGANSDPNPDNNHARLDQNAGSPNYNLHIWPNGDGGQFVPGGVINLELGYSNEGNMPMPNTLLTTTLPAGVEFEFAYTWDWNGWQLFTPTIVTDEYLVWDLGTFPNGYGRGLGVQLKISDDTQVGTMLEFKNSIKGAAEEYRYDDNSFIYKERVNDNGPNLRVDKHSNWGWNNDKDGTAYGLWYELKLSNLGTQPIQNIRITDTLPVSTTQIWCNWNWGPGNLGCSTDEVNHQVVFTMERMDPGNNASAQIWTDIVTDLIGVQGLEFINHVVAPVAGDVDLTNNQDTVTSSTGFDVFVTKWLKAGELMPGEFITYTVEMGNLNRWPFNGNGAAGSHITDTLPVSTTFIKAIPLWDLWGTFDPESINGQQIVWGWGPMWSNSAWAFDVVVQIDDDVLGGQVLLNKVEAYNDRPTDLELKPANNYFEYPLVIRPGEFAKLAPMNGAAGIPTNPTLSWEGDNGADSYQYCYDTTAGSTCDGTWTSTGTDTSVDLSGLSNDTTYYWQVRALNTGGTTYADDGTWWSFKTKPALMPIFLPIVMK